MGYTYKRVIPRDCFNEGNLIMMHGKLYLELSKLRLEECLLHDGSAFEIVQSVTTGSIYIRNINLVVNGRHIEMWRPLNSRELLPLMASMFGEAEGDDVNVFNPVSGTLSDDFIKLLIEAQQ